MTVRVERDFFVDASPEAVWAFLEDPSNRARAISLVESFETEDETTLWHLKLPILGVGPTITVRTRPLDRRSPEYVRFVGESSVFDVTGEHHIDQTEGKTSVHTRFEVTGRLPGVERFFEKRFDREIGNLENQLVAFLENR
ncbi:MAG: SRPBCC family protein [Halodesulfurarchaeum sp.]|nr:SRPBCC family protein [Halodesulfurarchaeum sp.]